MLIAIHIEAPFTSHSRKGWMLYREDNSGEKTTFEFEGFLDEGFSGHQLLKKSFPEAIEVCHMDVSGNYYTEAKRRRIFPEGK